MSIIEKRTEINWIDFAKSVAILAVLTDHLECIVYTNHKIAIASYFSVSLFVILSGITSYISDNHHQETWKENIIRSSRKIVIMYFVATIVYELFLRGQFDFLEFVKYLIGFNICGPFYFVLLYLQLMLINKFLFQILRYTSQKKNGIIYDMLFFIVIIAVAYYAMNHSNILSVYGGGGVLFGGTYLILYYVGMLFAKYDVFRILCTSENKRAFNWIMMAGSVISAVAWWRFECIDQYLIDTKIPFGMGKNPPSISSSIMSILVMFGCFFTYTALNKVQLFSKIMSVFCYIGIHSLYIFLYHPFVLEILLKPYISFNNTWVNRIAYMVIMIIGSLIVFYILELMKRIITKLGLLA